MPPTCPAGMLRGGSIGAPALANGVAADAVASGVAVVQLDGTDRPPTACIAICRRTQ